MRIRAHLFILAATAAGLATTPAHATQGLLCRPLSGSGPTLSLLLAAGGGVGGAHVMEGRFSRDAPATAWRPVPVRQSWIDEHRVWVDLTDEARMRDEGKLRAVFVRSGRSWHVAGSFVRGGRVHRVRCEED